LKTRTLIVVLALYETYVRQLTGCWNCFLYEFYTF